MGPESSPQPDLRPNVRPPGLRQGATPVGSGATRGTYDCAYVEGIGARGDESTAADRRRELLDSFALDGKVALVTGGNGGLGLAVAKVLAQAGATVAVTGRSVEKNREAAAALGEEAFVFEADVRSEDRAREVIAELTEIAGGLDILVNNAGILERGSVLDVELESWQRTIDTHLTGTLLWSKHGAAAMAGAGNGGRIVNVASMYSHFGPPDHCAYAAAKSGIVGLTKAMVVDLGPHQILVNVIFPGFVGPTELMQHDGTAEGVEIAAKTPQGRLGESEELAKTVLFLVSPAGSFINGAELFIDGGYKVADRPFSH
jgi:2-deoxy-D-gluconate 3-dehydrogenase